MYPAIWQPCYQAAKFQMYPRQVHKYIRYLATLFYQAAKFATVEENAKPGTLVTAITVTDQDRGDNGRTSLRITAGNELGHFKLDSR